MSKYILYHIAKNATVNDIIKEGLIPNKTKGITVAEPRPVVWLTDNPEFILTTQCGPKWIKKNNPKIIYVNVFSFKEEIKAKISWATGKPKICPFEFFVHCPISAQHISLDPFC